jgi:hypothetical protein
MAFGENRGPVKIAKEKSDGNMHAESYGRDVVLRPEHDPDCGRWLPLELTQEHRYTVTNLTCLLENVSVLGLFPQTMHFVHFPDDRSRIWKSNCLPRLQKRPASSS